MNGDDQNQTMNAVTDISEATVEANTVGTQETSSAPTDGPRKRRQRNYDGSWPLDHPGQEAVAQFLTAQKQFRQFKSFAAIAKRFDVSRMTAYRWAHDPDVVQRIEWLSEQNVVLGDFIACREWPGIVKAQVAAALAGDLRSAIFCQKRACREGSQFSSLSLKYALLGANNAATFLEGDEIPQAEELGTCKENPQAPEGEDEQK